MCYWHRIEVHSPVWYGMIYRSLKCLLTKIMNLEGRSIILLLILLRLCLTSVNEKFQDVFQELRDRYTVWEEFMAWYQKNSIIRVTLPSPCVVQYGIRRSDATSKTRKKLVYNGKVNVTWKSKTQLTMWKWSFPSKHMTDFINFLD